MLITTHYYTLLHISQCSNNRPPSGVQTSKLIYETDYEEVVYVLPTTSFNGRLPVVWAVNTRTIPSSATTRTSPSLIQAEGLKLLPKFLGNGPVQWPLKHNEVQHWLLQCTLFHITLYYYIEHKYVLLLNIMILPITMYYYKLLQIHYYILLHYYNIIITLL